ncbi:MAG TPA: hypothetical protein VFC18_08130 [Burkholderiales bacterium]|nr:hypothetical protein [Burkholderiales bacterium]
MDMTDLHAEGRYCRPGTLVLDVRSRREHRTGHVPGAPSSAPGW